MDRFLLALLIIQSISAAGQGTRPDTAFVRTSVQSALGVYTRAMQGESDLYNGSDYPEYIALKTGQHPFFLSEQPARGTILYGGQTYETALRYDICRDRVVIEHYYNHSILELVNERIGGFTIMDHHFIHLSGTDNGSLKDGLYDLLYNGNSTVLAKHEKVIEKISENQRIKYGFTSSTKYYVLKNGKYQSVFSKRSVLSVFEDRKVDLKKFLGDQRIRFRKSRAKAIAGMAQYYDTLNP